MKIAIPTDENTMESTVCMSFGRTPYFLIYDTETKGNYFLDNSAAASEGGAGIKAAQLLMDQSIEAVLTPRCGKNAADVLKGADIAIYKTNGDDLSDNLKAFAKDALALLDEIHAGLHNHGK